MSKPILVLDLGPCPTLGRSKSFPCSQLQNAAQEVMMSISAFLRPSMCSLFFTLKHSKQDFSPVFHKCSTSVSPVFTSFEPLVVSSVFHKGFTYVSPVSYHCLTSVSPLFHQCCTSVLQVFNHCFTSVLPVLY